MSYIYIYIYIYDISSLRFTTSGVRLMLCALAYSIAKN